MTTTRQNTQAASQTGGWMQKIQPWLMWSIGVLCLTQGLRLLWFSDSIGTLAGMGLLMPTPACCYLGWRDYRKLAKAGTVVMTRRAERTCAVVEPAA